MNGEVHWLPLAMLLAAAFPVAYLFVRGHYQDRKYKVEQKSVRCRTRGNQLVQCTLVRDAKTGLPIGIRDCSAYAGAEGSHCERTCLPLFAHPA
jgi:hypothetical protein